MIWMRALAPQRLEGNTLHLATQPGQRDLLKFVTAARRDQLAAAAKELLGRPIRIELTAGGTPLEEPAAPRGAGAAAGAAPPAGSALSARQQAMSLPLVREVLELFDATVLDVRPDQAAAPVPAGADTIGRAPAEAAPPGPDTLPGARPPSAAPLDSPEALDAAEPSDSAEDDNV